MTNQTQAMQLQNIDEARVENMGNFQATLGELQELKKQYDTKIIEGQYKVIWFDGKTREKQKESMFSLKGEIIEVIDGKGSVLSKLRIKGFSMILNKIEFFALHDNKVVYYFKLTVDESLGFTGTEGRYQVNWIHPLDL